MAITSEEQNQILGLLVGMFNAAPGASYLSDAESIYESVGNDLNELAQILAELDLFTTQFTDLDNEAVSNLIISNYGLSSGDDGIGDLAHSYVLDQLVSGTSKALLIKNITDLLLAPGIDSSLADVANTLTNKIEVSTSYSIDYSLSATTLSELQAVLENVTYEDASVITAIDALPVSSTATISSIVIPDGNYTYGGDINITINFNDNISISGVDSTLTLLIGDYQTDATLYSVTSNSLVFKYNVEDGYLSTESIIGVIENGINLNGISITDSSGLYADLRFSYTENVSAIVTDTQASEYTLYNAHYDTDTNILNLYGSGFNTILENGEDQNTNIVERIDFTKLIWDINSDDGIEDLTVYESGYIFSDDNILSVKVEDDNSIAIAINDTTLLESDANYSSLGGNDSIDILEGFLVDAAGNISQSASSNDIILGIDNILLGDDSVNTLFGTQNPDVIASLSGDDIIYSMEGNDVVSSGSGDDLIEGGLGIDTLSGGDGSDTFIFNNGDTYPLFSDNFGIDSILDLEINGSSADLIDLDVTILSVNSAVSGLASQETFIADMNVLLSVETIGFDTAVAGDISATTVDITSGDLNEETYLVVDYNANDQFDTSDFIINITGVTLTTLDTTTFI